MNSTLPFTAHEAPALLRDVLSVSLSAICVLRPLPGPDGSVADFALDYVNPAGQQVLGLPEQPRTTLLAQFPAARHNGVLAFLQQVFASGQAADFAPDLTAAAAFGRTGMQARRSGDWLLISHPAEPAADVVQALHASAANEDAAYAEALRQREKLYRILDEAPAMICVFDGPEHVFQFVNPAYQALVGARPLLGKPIAEAMPELLGQPVFELLDEVYRTGQTFYANEMLVQLDHGNQGQLPPDKHYYNFIYQARRGPAGAVEGIFVFAYEVTPLVDARQLIERQNSELEQRVVERTQALALAQTLAEQQRAELDQLFMQAPAAICVLDGPQLVYQFINPAYQQAFPGRSLLGKPLLAALPELRDSPIPAIIERVYATGEMYHAYELPLRIARTEDGPLEDTFWTFTYQARRDPAGQISGVFVFAYDVTGHVQAWQRIDASQRQTQQLADELSQTNARLLLANADLDNFIYTASHDLKAPITNIEGLLQALRQELTLPPAHGDVETLLHLMQDSVSRFQRTIKYLTDVTRLQQTLDLPAAPVPLRQLLDEVCLDLAPLLAVSNGQVQLAPDSCQVVWFAEKNLRSIVYNLVSNALKYRAPNRPPLVLVRCLTNEPAAMVLEVHDNGLGLTPEQRAKVFGMFQRLHDHVDGSGIGLYLVKKVVENAGGRIEVESHLGEGSVFRVILPQPVSATAAYSA